MSDDTPSPLNNVITIDDERIKSHLDRVVRGTVEETLNALLDAEADRLCNAQRYERSDARRDHYERGLQTKAGDVQLRLPKLRRIAHLRFPVTHRRGIRTTNLLERLFVEERRCLKIIPNAFGERAVLKLMFGALIRAAERWRSIKVTEFEHRQITAVAKELDQEYEAQIGLKTQLSKDAAPVKISSNLQT